MVSERLFGYINTEEEPTADERVRVDDDGVMWLKLNEDGPQEPFTKFKEKHLNEKPTEEEIEADEKFRFRQWKKRFGYIEV